MSDVTVDVMWLPLCKKDIIKKLSVKVMFYSYDIHEISLSMKLCMVTQLIITMIIAAITNTNTICSAVKDRFHYWDQLILENDIKGPHSLGLISL